MAAWKLKEASDTWETVCERAYAGEPQTIMRDGSPTLVVVTLVQYEKARRPQRESCRGKSFVDFLLSAPKLAEGEELDVSRDKNDFGREVSL